MSETKHLPDSDAGERGLIMRLISAIFRLITKPVEHLAEKFSLEISVGDTAKITGHRWVTCINTVPVRSRNRSFIFGGSGSIDRHGTVKVLRVLQERSLVVVRYCRDAQAAGAQCPDGAIFLLTVPQFLVMRGVPFVIADLSEDIFWCLDPARLMHEKNPARPVSGDPYRTSGMPVFGTRIPIPETHWREVQNAGGISNANCRFARGDQAVFIRHGAFVVHSHAGGYALASYEPPATEISAAGTCAAKGTMVLLEAGDASLMNAVYEKVRVFEKTVASFVPRPVLPPCVSHPRV